MTHERIRLGISACLLGEPVRCRYYMGRRTADDARQIRRWRAIARHVAAIRKHCELGDVECRRRQRQAVLHWAYDSRKI